MQNARTCLCFLLVALSMNVLPVCLNATIHPRMHHELYFLTEFNNIETKEILASPYYFFVAACARSAARPCIRRRRWTSTTIKLHPLTVGGAEDGGALQSFLHLVPNILVTCGLSLK